MTLLVIIVIAVKEFLLQPDPELTRQRKTKQYRLWDYYTGKWAYEVLLGRNWQEQDPGSD
jgi:hypothetical protein